LELKTSLFSPSLVKRFNVSKDGNATHRVKKTAKGFSGNLVKNKQRRTISGDMDARKHHANADTNANSVAKTPMSPTHPLMRMTNDNVDNPHNNVLSLPHDKTPFQSGRLEYNS
jgi:hypothetical protein